MSFNMSFNTAFARKSHLGAGTFPMPFARSLGCLAGHSARHRQRDHPVVALVRPNPSRLRACRWLRDKPTGVAVLPQTSTAGAFWNQNPGLGESWTFLATASTGPTAATDQLPIPASLTSSGHLVMSYIRICASPFATGHSWGVAGANASPSCSPYCYNAWASYSRRPLAIRLHKSISC